VRPSHVTLHSLRTATVAPHARALRDTLITILLNVGNSRRIGAGFEIDQGVVNFRCCLRECQQDFANMRMCHAVSHPDASLQRDGYFYVTQGEKTLANQTHAGGHPAPLRVPIKLRTHMFLFIAQRCSAGTMRAMGSSASEMRGRDMCAGGIQVCVSLL
jgi:hypothetical protein